MSTPSAVDILTAAGQALYGNEAWKRPLARALDVKPRTMHRWIAGDMPIPRAVMDQLVALVRERRDACEQVMRLLEIH